MGALYTDEREAPRAAFGHVRVTRLALPPRAAAVEWHVARAPPDHPRAMCSRVRMYANAEVDRGGILVRASVPPLLKYAIVLFGDTWHGYDHADVYAKRDRERELALLVPASVPRNLRRAATEALRATSVAVHALRGDLNAACVSTPLDEVHAAFYLAYIEPGPAPDDATVYEQLMHVAVAEDEKAHAGASGPSGPLAPEHGERVRAIAKPGTFAFLRAAHRMLTVLVSLVICATLKFMSLYLEPLHGTGGWYLLVLRAALECVAIAMGAAVLVEGLSALGATLGTWARATIGRVFPWYLALIQQRGKAATAIKCLIRLSVPMLSGFVGPAGPFVLPLVTQTVDQLIGAEYMGKWCDPADFALRALGALGLHVPFNLKGIHAFASALGSLTLDWQELLGLIGAENGMERAYTVLKNAMAVASAAGLPVPPMPKSIAGGVGGYMAQWAFLAVLAALSAAYPSAGENADAMAWRAKSFTVRFFDRYASLGLLHFVPVPAAKVLSTCDLMHPITAAKEAAAKEAAAKEAAAEEAAVLKDFGLTPADLAAVRGIGKKANVGLEAAYAEHVTNKLGGQRSPKERAALRDAIVFARSTGHATGSPDLATIARLMALPAFVAFHANADNAKAIADGTALGGIFRDETSREMVAKLGELGEIRSALRSTRDVATQHSLYERAKGIVRGVGAGASADGVLENLGIASPVPLTPADLAAVAKDFSMTPADLAAVRAIAVKANVGLEAAYAEIVTDQIGAGMGTAERAALHAQIRAARSMRDSQNKPDLATIARLMANPAFVAFYAHNAKAIADGTALGGIFRDETSKKMVAKLGWLGAIRNELQSTGERDVAAQNSLYNRAKDIVRGVGVGASADGVLETLGIISPARAAVAKDLGLTAADLAAVTAAGENGNVGLEAAFAEYVTNQIGGQRSPKERPALRDAIVFARSTGHATGSPDLATIARLVANPAFVAFWNIHKQEIADGTMMGGVFRGDKRVLALVAKTGELAVRELQADIARYTAKQLPTDTRISDDDDGVAHVLAADGSHLDEREDFDHAILAEYFKLSAAIDDVRGLGDGDADALRATLRGGRTTPAMRAFNDLLRSRDLHVRIDNAGGDLIVTRVANGQQIGKEEENRIIASFTAFLKAGAESHRQPEPEAPKPAEPTTGDDAAPRQEGDAQGEAPENAAWEPYANSGDRYFGWFYRISGKYTENGRTAKIVPREGAQITAADEANVAAYKLVWLDRQLSYLSLAISESPFRIGDNGRLEGTGTDAQRTELSQNLAKLNAFLAESGKSLPTNGTKEEWAALLGKLRDPQREEPHAPNEEPYETTATALGVPLEMAILLREKARSNGGLEGAYAELLTQAVEKGRSISAEDRQELKTRFWAAYIAPDKSREKLVANKAFREYAIANREGIASGTLAKGIFRGDAAALALVAAIKQEQAPPVPPPPGPTRDTWPTTEVAAKARADHETAKRLHAGWKRAQKADFAIPAADLKMNGEFPALTNINEFSFTQAEASREIKHLYAETKQFLREIWDRRRVLSAELKPGLSQIQETEIRARILQIDLMVSSATGHGTSADVPPMPIPTQEEADRDATEAKRKAVLAEEYAASEKQRKDVAAATRAADAAEAKRAAAAKQAKADARAPYEVAGDNADTGRAQLTKEGLSFPAPALKDGVLEYFDDTTIGTKDKGGKIKALTFSDKSGGLFTSQETNDKEIRLNKLLATLKTNTEWIRERDLALRRRARGSADEQAANTAERRVLAEWMQYHAGVPGIARPTTPHPIKQSMSGSDGHTEYNPYAMRAEAGHEVYKPSLQISITFEPTDPRRQALLQLAEAMRKASDAVEETRKSPFVKLDEYAAAAKAETDVGAKKILENIAQEYQAIVNTYTFVDLNSIRDDAKAKQAAYKAAATEVAKYLRRIKLNKGVSVAKIADALELQGNGALFDPITIAATGTDKAKIDTDHGKAPSGATLDELELARKAAVDYADKHDLVYRLNVARDKENALRVTGATESEKLAAANETKALQSTYDATGATQEDKDRYFNGYRDAHIAKMRAYTDILGRLIEHGIRDPYKSQRSLGALASLQARRSDILKQIEVHEAPEISERVLDPLNGKWIFNKKPTKQQVLDSQRETPVALDEHQDAYVFPGVDLVVQAFPQALGAESSSTGNVGTTDDVPAEAAPQAPIEPENTGGAFAAAGAATVAATAVAASEFVGAVAASVTGAAQAAATAASNAASGLTEQNEARLAHHDLTRAADAANGDTATRLRALAQEAYEARSSKVADRKAKVDAIKKEAEEAGFTGFTPFFHGLPVLAPWKTPAEAERAAELGMRPTVRAVPIATTVAPRVLVIGDYQGKATRAGTVRVHGDGRVATCNPQQSAGFWRHLASRVRDAYALEIPAAALLGVFFSASEVDAGARSACDMLGDGLCVVPYALHCSTKPPDAELHAIGAFAAGDEVYVVSSRTRKQIKGANVERIDRGVPNKRFLATTRAEYAWAATLDTVIDGLAQKK
jgi:hypothetical protein